MGACRAGLSGLVAYCIGYTAQATGYVLLVTDRYPTTDPARVAPFLELPLHPVRLDLTDDVRRSRLTVFFRFPLAVPHLIWLTLWTALVGLLALPVWIVALAMRPAAIAVPPVLLCVDRATRPTCSRSST